MGPEKCKLTLARFLSSLQISLDGFELAAEGRETSDSLIEPFRVLSADVHNQLDVVAFVNSDVVLDCLAGFEDDSFTIPDKGELCRQHLRGVDHGFDSRDIPGDYAIGYAVKGSPRLLVIWIVCSGPV